MATIETAGSIIPPPPEDEVEAKGPAADHPVAPAASSAVEPRPERPKLITPEDRRSIEGQLRGLFKKVEQGESGDAALQLARRLAHLHRAGEGKLKNQKKIFAVLRNQADRYRSMEQPLKLAQYLTYLKYIGAQETIDQGDAQLIQLAIQTQIDRNDTDGLSQLCMYAKFIGAQEDFTAAQPLLQADFRGIQKSGDAEAAAYELARRKYVGLAHSTAQKMPPYGEKNYAPGETIEGTVPEQTLDDLGVHERLGQMLENGQWPEFARLRLVADYLRGPRGLNRETRQQLKAHLPTLVGKARENGRWAAPVSYLADVRRLLSRTRDITPRELTDLTREKIEEQAAEWVQGDRPLPDSENVLDAPVIPTEGDTSVRAGETTPLPLSEMAQPEGAPLTEAEASARYGERLAKRRAERGFSTQTPGPFSVAETPRFVEVSTASTPEVTPLHEQPEASTRWWQRVRGWFKRSRVDTLGGRAETGIESPDERLARITTVLNAAAVAMPAGDIRSYYASIADAKQHGESLEQWVGHHTDIVSRLQNDFLIPPAEAWDAVTSATTVADEASTAEAVIPPEPAMAPAADTEPAIAMTSDAANAESVPASRWPREFVEEWTDEQREALVEELKNNFKYAPLRSVKWSLYEDIVYYQEQGVAFEQWEQEAAEVVSYMNKHDLPPAEAWELIRGMRSGSTG